MRGGTIRTGSLHRHTQPFRHVRVDDSNSMDCYLPRQVEHRPLPHLPQILQREEVERPPAYVEEGQERGHVTVLEVVDEHAR